MSLKSRQKGFGKNYPAVVAALLLNFIFIGEGIAQTYDVAKDFSVTNNPNATWSYGWSATRGGNFNLYDKVTDENSLKKIYHSGSSSLEPSVYYNPNAQAVQAFTWWLQPAKVNFHPGPGGENSVIRWTAPMPGNIRIDAVFTGVDFAYPTTTDVAVIYNSSTELWSGSINTYNIPTSVSKTLTVNTGDRVDFTVGYGSNNDYHGDSTGIDITVEYSCYTREQLDKAVTDATASMYTKAQLDSAKQAAIQSCKDNPSSCGLFSQSQIDAAKQDGISLVRTNPADYQLLTQAQSDQAVKNEQLKWDANGDGRIGLEDIIRMLQVLAGLRP